MYDLALNVKTNDLVINKDVILIDNAERVAQQIRIRLNSFLGEWFLNTSYGLPYLEYILIKNPNLTLVRSILRKQIASVDDVAKVNSLTVTLDNKTRKLTVDFECATSYGLVTGKEVLGYNE